jgi:hypothetical protein
MIFRSSFTRSSFTRSDRVILWQGNRGRNVISHRNQPTRKHAAKRLVQQRRGFTLVHASVYGLAFSFVMALCATSLHYCMQSQKIIREQYVRHRALFALTEYLRDDLHQAATWQTAGNQLNIVIHRPSGQPRQITYRVSGRFLERLEQDAHTSSVLRRERFDLPVETVQLEETEQKHFRVIIGPARQPWVIFVNRSSGTARSVRAMNDNSLTNQP